MYPLGEILRSNKSFHLHSEENAYYSKDELEFCKKIHDKKSNNMIKIIEKFGVESLVLDFQIMDYRYL